VHPLCEARRREPQRLHPATGLNGEDLLGGQSLHFLLLAQLLEE
jgi:hypothetical protein